MEDAGNILTQLLATTQGTIFIFLVLGILSGLIVFLFVRFGKNVDSISRDGIKFKNNDLKSYTLMKTAVQDVLRTEYDSFIEKRDAIKNTTLIEYSSTQTLILTRAIQHLTMSFSELVPDNIEVENMSRLAKILELCLSKDFSQIMISKLETLKTHIQERRDTNDILGDVPDITNDIMVTMKNRFIQEYNILFGNKISTEKLFESNSKQIRDYLSTAIERFKESTDAEKEKIIKAEKIRDEAIAAKLNSLLGEEKED
jgi:hypothetical protein